MFRPFSKGKKKVKKSDFQLKSESCISVNNLLQYFSTNQRKMPIKAKLINLQHCLRNVPCMVYPLSNCHIVALRERRNMQESHPHQWWNIGDRNWSPTSWKGNIHQNQYGSAPIRHTGRAKWSVSHLGTIVRINIDNINFNSKWLTTNK